MSDRLIPPDEAVKLVLERVEPLGGEAVPIADALGRVLAEDLDADDDVPSFDNSAMDGFAVRASDTRGAAPGSPVQLALAGESRAGSPADRGPGPGEAVRISTGAMVPAGADAVVRVEDTNEADGHVAIFAEVSSGKEIRRAGEDVRAGDRVLERGTRLGPAELGVAASVGRAELLCTRKPRVAVLGTGDELVGPEAPLGPGQIRNTNGIALPAQVVEAGGVVTQATTVPDDPDATVRMIEEALDGDVLIVTGGMSVGPHDHVRPALDALGVEQVFWGVALRPGKPTLFGVRENTLVFGLPGNPVSAMVTFHLFVRPALAALLGAPDPVRRTEAVFDEDYAKRPGRAEVVRCRLEPRDDGWHVRPTKAQGSHVLTSMLDAEALAFLEVERWDVSAGERVEIEIL
jgi:molybdopterin molybdotransferase